MNYFIIEKEPRIKEYVRHIKIIKEILITIKNLKHGRENPATLNKYYQKLFDNFNDFSNCSEFGCFVNACDTTRDLIKKDFKSFKRITDFFIQKRILDDKAPENWIQAILDSNASRKKGKLGEIKLINILNKSGYQLAKAWDDFNNTEKVVASFSKDVFSTAEVKRRFNINLKTKNQDKMLDLLIKNNKKLFILEAKHLNTGGGEQNKQLDELIKILELKESSKNIYYIAFLDGTYSNLLINGVLSKRSRKLLKQRGQIENYLKKSGAQNYWVNTAGFKEIVKDL